MTTPAAAGTQDPTSQSAPAASASSTTAPAAGLSPGAASEATQASNATSRPTARDEPIAIEPGQQQAAEPADDTDADSAYDSELASYTTSLASAVTDYKHLHGRRYHAHKEGAYIFPNDDLEADRMDIAHKMADTAMGNRLYWAPLSAASPPKRILDLGTGTGIWAMEMGDKFPNADVVGNDLSPIQPRWVPPNVHFEVDDLESDWTYTTPFDFIHARQLYSAISDWPRLFDQTMEHLRPGAWCEFVDVDLNWTSPDGTITDTSPLRVTSNKFQEFCRIGGKEPCPGPRLQGWMKDAGFVDTFSQRIPLPMGTWPADKRLKETGAWNFLQFNEGIEGFITFIFSGSGYSREECEVIAAQCRAEAKNPKIHSMFWLYVAYGRKPLPEERKA